MKMRLAVLSVISLIGLVPGVAYSGNTTGTISELLLLSSYPDRVFVRLQGANVGLPFCSNVGNRYVLDSGTGTGKQIYAALLAAKHAGVPVTLIGSGSCNLVSNSEDLVGITQN